MPLKLIQDIIKVNPSAKFHDHTINGSDTDTKTVEGALSSVNIFLKCDILVHNPYVSLVTKVPCFLKPEKNYMSPFLYEIKVHDPPINGMKIPLATRKKLQVPLDPPCHTVPEVQTHKLTHRGIPERFSVYKRFLHIEEDGYMKSQPK